MNMFKPSNVHSVSEYIEALPKERKEIIEFLHNLIKKTVPSLKPNFAYNMLGYGTMKYTNYKKEEQDWPIVALASQKNYVSLYICAVLDGEYIAEKYKDELGKVSVGKSCIRFKKLEDLDLEAIKKVLKLAEKHLGFVSASEHKKSQKKNTKKK